MPYAGWKIFTYQYQDELHVLQEKTSKLELSDTIKQRFSDTDWMVAANPSGLLLTHVPTQFEVKVTIHGWELPIEYDTGVLTETYLVLLESDCLSWKHIETDHKRLMSDVLDRLPWRKAAGYLEDGHLDLRYDSNAQPGDSQRIRPIRLLECPIPDRPRLSAALLMPPRLVEVHPKRPKQRRKVNALKDLIKQVDKEKAQKKRNHIGH
jgi:hypothetical protein